MRRLEGFKRFVPSEEWLERRRSGIDNPPTRREVQLLYEWASGESTESRRIAEDWGISEDTVNKHQDNVMKKLDAHDRTQALARAYRRGWVTRDGLEEKG